MINGVSVYDLRQDQTNPPKKGGLCRVRRGRVVNRPPRIVDSIVVHQTACEFGPRRSDLRKHGNRQAAIAARSLGIACHATSFDGFYALPNPLTWYVNQANRLNRRSLGLEIEGLYPGIEGGRVWSTRRPTLLTKGRIDAARMALEHLVDEGRSAGMPITHVFAHRQSSMTRRGDPGEEIWREVVLDFAVADLGLTVINNLRDGGRAIPWQWDPNAKRGY